MVIFDNYVNTKIELNYLLEKLELVNQYAEKLENEKNDIICLINSYKELIQKIEHDLQNLSGIENKLYREIVINNLNVSKAIEKVAFEENKDVSTLWKNYYPNVKLKIEFLRNKEVNNERNRVNRQTRT